MHMDVSFFFLFQFVVLLLFLAPWQVTYPLIKTEMTGISSSGHLDFLVNNELVLALPKCRYIVTIGLDPSMCSKYVFPFYLFGRPLRI